MSLGWGMLLVISEMSELSLSTWKTKNDHNKKGKWNKGIKKKKPSLITLHVSFWAFLELQAAPCTAWPPKVTDRIWHPHVFLWQEKCPLHSGLKTQSRVCNLPDFLGCSFGHRAFEFLIGLEVQLWLVSTWRPKMQWDFPGWLDQQSVLPSNYITED